MQSAQRATLSGGRAPLTVSRRAPRTHAGYCRSPGSTLTRRRSGGAGLRPRDGHQRLVGAARKLQSPGVGDLEGQAPAVDGMRARRNSGGCEARESFLVQSKTRRAGRDQSRRFFKGAAQKFFFSNSRLSGRQWSAAGAGEGSYPARLSAIQARGPRGKWWGKQCKYGTQPLVYTRAFDIVRPKLPPPVSLRTFGSGGEGYRSAMGLLSVIQALFRVARVR